MDEPSDTLAESELTPEDLAVLRAFKEMEDLEAPPTLAQAASGTTGAAYAGPDDGAVHTESLESLVEQFFVPASSEDSNLLDDMLVLFATEADEDITIMRQALEQLEQESSLDAPAFVVLQRAAHKLKGTAGAVGCNSMSTIAYYIEMLVGLIQSKAVAQMIGLMALVQAVRALEMTLQSVINDGQESSTPLTELEAEYEALNEFGSAYRPATDSLTALVSNYEGEADAARTTSPLKEEIAHLHLASGPAPEVFSPLPSVHVDVHRLEQLVLHSEQLAEQHAQLENTRCEIDTALQELHAAQARLRHLEMLLSINTFETGDADERSARSLASRPTSSLIARIFDEAAQRTGHLPPSKSKSQALLIKVQQAREQQAWDELEVDRYSANDELVRAFGEAIADVSTASSQLRLAFDQFNRALNKHMDLAGSVRSDTLLLRSAPLGTLLPRVQRAIKMSADAQQRQVQFEFKGETTQIDQDILEALARPLLQLVRYCVIDSLEGLQEPSGMPARSQGTLLQYYHRVWLYAYAVGNEVTIELGFSMNVRSGAADLVRRPIAQLHGSIVAQPNSVGGSSFYLNLPRSQGAVQGLSVRAGSEHVVVPLSQVQRIDYGAREKYDSLCVLSTLLGFPGDQPAVEDRRPVLILQPGAAYAAVQVDDIQENIELVVKPLAKPLCRPGIAGAAIDGLGNVLLIVDLPRLMLHSLERRHIPESAALLSSRHEVQPQSAPAVLIADDSVYIRQSLQQMLSRSGYQVTLARDGMEAWEQLLAHTPDILLLDIEMPNLNGYDLLAMIRTSPQLSSLKIVMLTARTSEKHQRSARELGAQAYLTKPCSQDVLLATLNSLASAEDHSL
ncbi:MAG: response regulator [Chloroflexota bacterium]|nr:response regulator [Chloroflexota bacterium]